MKIKDLVQSRMDVLNAKNHSFNNKVPVMLASPMVVRGTGSALPVKDTLEKYAVLDVTSDQKKEAWRQYFNAYRRRKRAERGYKKRTPRTPEQIKASLERGKLYRSQWKKEHPLSVQKRILYAARRRAKDKKLPFDLTEEDILVPETCPYLGTPLTRTAPRGTQRINVASLDRIDPTKGYVKGNIEIMSHLANSMKNSATPEQLVIFAKEILKRYG